MSVSFLFLLCVVETGRPGMKAQGDLHSQAIEVLLHDDISSRGCSESFTRRFFGKGGEVAQKASIGVETDLCGFDRPNHWSYQSRRKIMSHQSPLSQWIAHRVNHVAEV